ncbi:MAG: response regulator transcription factor [Burkholderiales bacterium]|nr:response regulator transcription factor [Opitutaceae bacterium]
MTTILIIEDHEPLRLNLEDMLTLEGHRVLSATDGAAGLELARRGRPDLVICDIMLPGMDGWEILAAIRADAATAALPFVFLTAKGDAADVRAGMRLGADDYLPKPFKRADLLDAIRTRLQRAAQQRVFAPSFESSAPLEALGLTPREAEVLLWMAQGKANPEIAVIVGCSAATVKKHSIHLFEKLGVEGRAAAMLRALEALTQRAE